jgi:hypothetical protein
MFMLGFFVAMSLLFWWIIRAVYERRKDTTDNIQRRLMEDQHL